MFDWRRLRRLLAVEENRRVAQHAPGDRVVWRCSLGQGAPLVYSGTFVADGPGAQVTIRHDGAPGDAQVRPEQLFREFDYMILVESRGAPRPTIWG